MMSAVRQPDLGVAPAKATQDGFWRSHSITPSHARPHLEASPACTQSTTSSEQKVGGRWGSASVQHHRTGGPFVLYVQSLASTAPPWEF